MQKLVDLLIGYVSAFILGFPTKEWQDKTLSEDTLLFEFLELALDISIGDCLGKVPVLNALKTLW